jgi:hypothetical protein
MPEPPVRIELSGERLALYEALFRRSERIARMYLGAHYALPGGLNPERFAVAAHCVRELMEKVPEIVAVSTPAHSERLGAKVWLRAFLKYLRAADVARDPQPASAETPSRDRLAPLAQQIGRRRLHERLESAQVHPRSTQLGRSAVHDPQEQEVPTRGSFATTSGRPT